MVSGKTGPALKRIMVPAAAGEVLVAVEISVGQDIEPRALLVADDDRKRILELLAKADVHHARVERPRPHAHVEPPRPRPRAGHGAGKDQIFGNSEWHTTIPNH